MVTGATLQFDDAVSRAPAPRSDARTLKTLQALGRKLDPQDPAVARLAAGQMVSELFFKPLLAELRASGLGAEFAHGGFAESVFGEKLDEQIADAVASSTAGGFTDQLAELLSGGTNRRTAGKTDASQAGGVSWLTQLQAQKALETRKNESR